MVDCPQTTCGADAMALLFIAMSSVTSAWRFAMWLMLAWVQPGCVAGLYSVRAVTNPVAATGV